jgi:MtN3 and saliva related transmembrane protein
MNVIGLVGAAAAVCTTGAFVPQVAKTWRSRSAADISGHMFAIMALGNALWLAYGIALGDWAIIGANAVSLLLTLTMLALKLRHG